MLRDFTYILMAVAVILPFELSAHSDEIRFPEENFRPDLLEKIEQGPILLDRDSDMGIPPPPLNSSAETQIELDRLELILSQLRTSEQLELIHDENHADATIWGMFQNQGLLPYHSGSSPLFEILRITWHDSTFFTLREKQTYMRARPSQLSPDIMPAIPVPGHPAYPSGHATNAYAIAMALSALAPECTSSYYAHASMIAFRREIAGVHYASDTLAGFQVARIVTEKLLEHPVFELLLLDARKELHDHISRNGCEGAAIDED